MPRKTANKAAGAAAYWQLLAQQRLPTAAGWVCVVGADITARAAAATSFSKHDSLRDKFFALLMARFDVLQAERKGMIFLLRQARRQPKLAAQIMQAVAPQLAALAKQAGARAPLYAPALMVVYALAVRVWEHDTAADMASTMRAVDKNLGYMFMLAELLPQAR